MNTVALLMLTVIVCVLSVQAQITVQPADLVFKNGNIYTVDKHKPKAEAVAVKGGRITFVGSNRDVQPYIDDKTQVVDLNGKTMLPGLADAHQ